MTMPPEFRQAVYRLLTGRLILFGILLVCTGPLAALSPILWNDATVPRTFAGGYMVVSVGFTLLYAYGYFYSWRLRRRIDAVPPQTVTGTAHKVIQHFRMPMRAGGATFLGPNAFKMCQFLVIDKKRYAVPLWAPFDEIPDDVPITLTYVELGGPLMIKLRRIVLHWALAARP